MFRNFLGATFVNGKGGDGGKGGNGGYSGKAGGTGGVGGSAGGVDGQNGVNCEAPIGSPSCPCDSAPANCEKPCVPLLTGLWNTLRNLG